MKNIIVVESLQEWPAHTDEFEVVLDKEYISHKRFQTENRMRVFNLCRSYRYQSTGYYVSLLATARGHKVLPTVSTIQEMKSKSFLKIATENLDELVQRSLVDIKSDKFELSIYFGKNVAKKYDRLSTELYKHFVSPLVRAKFIKKDKWTLSAIGPIALKDVPSSHMADLIEAARCYFDRPYGTGKTIKNARFSMAILTNPEEKFPPSDKKAIDQFIQAGRKVGFEVDIIDHHDLRKLAEYDALFIRETTNVNHHTFRFSQKAKALGMVVIDDPDSILKCTNKVFLAELLSQNNIPAPESFILHKDNYRDYLTRLPLPCILKQPDSSFSQGVSKVENQADLQVELERLLETSDLVIGQEYLPTDFDWRIGFIGGRALYVCKYFMAKSHWQIYKTETSGKVTTGRAETIPVEEVPPRLMKLATKTAGLIGTGFYGLDIKERDGKYYVIEVNDNPSIDHGVEDKFLKNLLYEKIMNYFWHQLQK